MQWAGEAPARTTFFHNSLYLNDDGISEAWGAALAAGHEVGNHTKNHPNGRAEGYDVAAWNEQISLCSNELSAGRDVPAGAISGFRTPFLGYNEATFGSLVAQGLSYSFPGSRRGGAGSTRVQLRSACRGQSRAFRVRGSHARLRFELRRQCRRHGRPTPGRDRGLLGLRTRQDRNAYGAPARRRRMDAASADAHGPGPVVGRGGASGSGGSTSPSGGSPALGGSGGEESGPDGSGADAGCSCRTAPTRMGSRYGGLALACLAIVTLGARRQRSPE